MEDRYPGIVLEEAEVLVDLLGLHNDMVDWAAQCCHTLETLPKNLYIFGLLAALFYELEEAETCSLTPEQIPMCRNFLDRAQACERFEVGI